MAPAVFDSAIGHRGAAEGGIRQIGILEVGPGEVGIDQAGTAQVGPGEVDAPGTDAAQIRPGEIAASTDLAGEGSVAAEIAPADVRVLARDARCRTPARLALDVRTLVLTTVLTLPVLALAVGGIKGQKETGDQSADGDSSRTELPCETIETFSVHADTSAQSSLSGSTMRATGV